MLLDMIGDKDLVIRREAGSTPWLVDIVWSAAAELGHRSVFSNEEAAVDDDHVPFIRAGIPAVDIIDLDYAAGTPPRIRSRTSAPESADRRRCRARRAARYRSEAALKLPVQHRFDPRLTAGAQTFDAKHDHRSPDQRKPDRLLAAEWFVSTRVPRPNWMVGAMNCRMPMAESGTR